MILQIVSDASNMNPMPTRALSQDWHYRGKFDARIPGLPTIVWSAVEALDIPPSIAGPMSNGARWLLLYLFTPANIKVDGKPWQLCPANTALIMTPGTRYWVDTRGPNEPSHHTWLLIDGLHALPVFPLTQDRDGMAWFLDPQGLLATELARYIEIVDSQRSDPFWCMQVCSSGIFDMLGKAVPGADMKNRITPKSVARKIDPIVARILAYLQANLSKHVKLKDIAIALHASPSTISHRYRAFADETPMQTLKRLRLFEAKIRLLRGELTEDIAESVGFCDARHLWAAFKHSEGISPQAFVKTTRLAQTPRAPDPEPGMRPSGSQRNS